MCRKKGCLIPCYIINFILYAFIISFTIYGLIKFIKADNGFIHTQCSYFNFFLYFISGDEKETEPKLIGIENTNNILSGLNFSLTYIKNNNNDVDLYTYVNKLEIEKNNFFEKLKNIHKKFLKNDEMTPIEGYLVDYQENNIHYVEGKSSVLYLRKKYILDLIPLFGRYHSENESFSGLISFWNKEFSVNYKGAKNSINKTIMISQKILNNNYFNITDEIDYNINKLDDLKGPLEIIYNNLIKSFESNKDNLYYTGYMILIILSLMLLCLSVIIVFAFIMLYFKICIRFFKYVDHILWNISAIIMVFFFLGGPIIALFGRCCEDMTSVISYIVSPDNFESQDPIILKEFQTGKEILKELIVGEGNLSKVIILDNFNREMEILYVETFNYLKISHPSYNILKTLLEKKTEFIDDTYLYYYDSSPIDSDIIQKVKLDESLKLLNDSIGDLSNERWDKFQGNKNFRCNYGHSPENNLLHPWVCEPLNRNWVRNSNNNNNNIKNYAQIASDIIALLKFANGTTNGGENYYDILKGLLNDYDKYLNISINTLNIFDTYYTNIINEVEEEIRYENDSFSSINGESFKSNINILLKYLNTLGKNSYIVGLCLIIIGIFLILSTISSSLLLIILDDIHFNDSNYKLQ